MKPGRRARLDRPSKATARWTSEWTAPRNPRRRLEAQAGRLRPEQALFLERIRCAGGMAFVARDLRDVLRELDNKKGPTP